MTEHPTQTPIPSPEDARWRELLHRVPVPVDLEERILRQLSSEIGMGNDPVVRPVPGWGSRRRWLQFATAGAVALGVGLAGDHWWRRPYTRTELSQSLEVWRAAIRSDGWQSRESIRHEVVWPREIVASPRFLCQELIDDWECQVTVFDVTLARQTAYLFCASLRRSLDQFSAVPQATAPTSTGWTYQAWAPQVASANGEVATGRNWLYALAYQGAPPSLWIRSTGSQLT